MAKRLKKELRALRRLLEEVPLPTLLRIFIYNRLGKRRLVSVRVSGKAVHVRTSTPDLEVALSTLGGEFDCLRLAYPRSHKGLIVDAGGYIGTAAVALAEMYPEATIVSIEPAQDNFEVLVKNTSRYGNVFPRSAALVPDAATGQVGLMSRGTGEWGFTVVENPEDRPATFVDNVDTVTFDGILREYGFERIMICKMDVEGAEYELLRRSDWLEETDVLMIELHERIVPGCEHAFAEANESRFVYSSGSEKLVSVGKGYFASVDTDCRHRPPLP